MAFPQPKRKRGRPRKNPLPFNVVSETVQPIQETNYSPTEQAETDTSSTTKNSEFEVEDWERELDGNLTSTDLNSPDSTQIESHFTNNLLENSKQQTKIHIVDSEKGGAGKSFFSRTFIEYCAFKDLDVAIVDADTSNRDIAKLYDDVELAFFSDDEKKASYADKIFDLALSKSVVVNLPAQVYSNVTNWIKRNNLTELGKEHSISFIKWFVCTGGVDSVNFFLKSLEDLGDDITHVFVKNLGLCDEWNYIEQMPEFVAAQDKYKFIVMEFPRFPFWERNMIDRLEITFERAVSHPEFKAVSKQRVKNYLRRIYASLAATELIE
ncbi:MAG: cobalamin biosynthesis protein CobQ [Rivularia sp. (in: cyanobacteria)]